MRLPCDAALIVIDVQRAPERSASGARNNPDAETAVAALLAAWRAEGLPVAHAARNDRSRSGVAGFRPEAAPLPGELVIARSDPSAFAEGALEAALDAIGATTLVVCGALTPGAVEATVRHAVALGYRVFVVDDACWAVDIRDARGRLWAADDVHALSLAHIAADYARVVDLPTALAAAAGARRRQRWDAARAAAQARAG